MHFRLGIVSVNIFCIENHDEDVKIQNIYRSTSYRVINSCIVNDTCKF